MTIEEYVEEARNDSNVDVSQLTGGLVSLSIRIEKWSKYKHDEMCISNEMESKRDEIYKRRYKYYLYDDPLKIDKKNIDIWVHGDDEFRDYDVLYKKQKAKEQYVDNILIMLDKMTFVYQIILKNEMFRAGVS